jgi:O-antigen ligase
MVAMDKLLEGSFVVHLLVLCYAAWRRSGLRRFFVMIRSAWRYSRFRKVWNRFWGMEPRQTETSCLHRNFVRLNTRLARCRIPVRMLRDSMIGKLYGAIVRCGRESRLLGWLFRGGMTRIILFAIALYLPIDYVLRDVMQIPVISSLWDEALLLLAACWLVRTRMARPQPVLPRANVLDMPVVLFMGVGLALMFAVSPFFSIAVSGYRATVQYLLWFFIVTRLLRDDADFHVIYLTLVAIAFLIALHGLYQFIVAAPIPSNWVDQAEQSVRTRVYSIFGSPNIMGDFMVMFAPMTAALAYYFRDRKIQILCWLATFCMCFSCLFTMSRGAWMAMAVAVLVFALLQDRRLLGLMLLAAVIAMFLPFVASRIGYLFTEDFANSTSNGGRASRWALALEYLSTNPLFGFGLGMFGGAVAMQNQVYNWISYFYVDNYYLKILVEMGYVGFAAFLLMMACALITGGRAVYRNRKDPVRPLCVGILSGLCGVLVHCYFENIFEEPYMMVYFWTMAAMLVYLGFFRHRRTVMER